MKRKLDKIDRKILKIVQTDVSISMDALAERVDLSRNACWRRFKQLDEDGVIKRRVAILDPNALNLGLAVIVQIRTNTHDPVWLKQFEEAVNNIPEILGAHRTSGDLDYVLRVRVADVEGYDRFYKQLIDQVAIADISASFVMEDLKDTTELPVT